MSSGVLRCALTCPNAGDNVSARNSWVKSIRIARGSRAAKAMSKLHLITYGCQMNEYDSERVAGLLGKEQYELTDRPDEADVILLNTCAIREKAEDKVFSQLGSLRHLKRARPDL